MDENRKGEKFTEGAGRMPTDKQDDQTLQEKASRDISEIDRQEGSMNNGALGGNFEQEGEKDDESTGS